MEAVKAAKGEIALAPDFATLLDAFPTRRGTQILLFMDLY